MAISFSELLLSPVNAVMHGRNRRDDVSYGTDTSMTYDEYPSLSDTAPLVVFWYGGGWKSGRKEMYRFVGHALQRMGAHAFVVDYPKYPKRVYPGFLDDAVEAVNHIKGRFPGRKLILMGHSSGGHTALLVAMRRLIQADAVVTMAAPCTIDEHYWRPVFGDVIRSGEIDPRTYAETSPEGLSVLLLHGAKDTIVGPDDSISLNRALQSRGKDSELGILAHVNHQLIVPIIMLGLAPAVRTRLRRYLMR